MDGLGSLRFTQVFLSDLDDGNCFHLHNILCHVVSCSEETARAPDLQRDDAFYILLQSMRRDTKAKSEYGTGHGSCFGSLEPDFDRAKSNCPWTILQDFGVRSLIFSLY